MLPNFLLCGAQKSASTSLYHWLRAHPDVFLTREKEPNFFNFHYDRGIEWYEGLFAEWNGQRAAGEASIRYMRDPAVPGRLARHLPEARLLFVLRNPIERAWSHYWFRLGKREDEGMPYTGPSFGEVIRDPADPVHTVEWGYYCDHLKRFEAHFARKHMLVLLTEDLRERPSESMRRVFEFLGVDPNVELPALARHNVTAYPASYGLYRGLRAVYRPLERGLRALRLGGLVDAAEGLRVAVRGRALRHSRTRAPRMKPEDREYLCAIYREPNRALAEYLGRDLSHWK